MEYFYGLDVAVDDTAVCVVDEHGEVHLRVKVGTDPDALFVALKPFVATGHQIADPDLDQVIPAKLAVDCQIKQRTVANAPFPIGKKRIAQICFWVKGRLVPTFFPAFQAVRSRLASSN